LPIVEKWVPYKSVFNDLTLQNCTILFLEECEIVAKYLKGEGNMGQSLRLCLDWGVESWGWESESVRRKCEKT